MREVCVNGSVDFDGAGSGSPVHKNELEKVNGEHMQLRWNRNSFSPKMLIK